jgi:hypothetical protein
VTRSGHTDVDVTQWLFAFNPYRRSRLMTLNGQVSIRSRRSDNVSLKF